MLRNFTVVILLFTLNFISINANATTFDWEIGNRFRAFDYLAKNNTAESARIFKLNAPPATGKSISTWMNERVAISTNDLSPYGKSLKTPWNENLATYDSKFVDLPNEIQLIFNAHRDNPLLMPVGKCEIHLEEKMLGVNDCSKEIIINNFPSLGGTVQIKNNGKIIYSELIKPKLTVILGLGDSYGAGEGAPDNKTIWKAPIKGQVFEDNEHKQKFINKWTYSDKGLSDIDQYLIDKPAQWYSNRCNRSYFSAQSLAALKIASLHPHEVVSFVHFSCAAAEIVDGILAPQRTAPGSEMYCHKRSNKKLKTLDLNCDVPKSQLTAAVDLFCKDGAGTSLAKDVIKTLADTLKNIPNYPGREGQIDRINELRVCNTEPKVKPSYIFLQIGGNDIGFGGAVMWSLVPNDGRTPLGDRVVAYARGTTICPDIKSVETFGSKTCKGKNKNEKILNSATGRLKDLPKRYEALNYAIKNLLGVEKKDIVIAGYTNPLLNAHGEYCSNPANIADNKNEWGLARLIIPTETIAPVWDLNLTYKEVKEVDTYVVQNLNNTILNSSKNLEWQYVDVDNVMKNHGWCVDGNTNHARLMYLPKDVYKWNGYEDHKRMIRTGNDSVLTQFRSSNYPDFIGGILHPNVQGYAEMADAILATVVH